MIIGLHDAEAEHFGTLNKFPNYALMKISAWHKSHGDEVEWWYPLGRFDKVYSSKVFEFTPENLYLPPDTIRGGTGYGKYDDLPTEVDAMFPDYTIYPTCDYAIGYLTRGCIRKCSWCVVPKKEGYIHPYRRWQDVVRDDTDKLTLMDNNILACDYGISQLEELTKTDYRLDINQGMDARLVTPEIADILAGLKWQRMLRFACDQQSQIDPVLRTVELLSARGIRHNNISIYCIITKDVEDDLKRIYSLRGHGNIAIYAQAERNPSKGIFPEHWQKEMSRWCFSGAWRKTDWDEWRQGGKDDKSRCHFDP